MGSKREAKNLAYFVTKSNGFGKGSEVLGRLTLSQSVMGSKREAKYLAYFVTKSNDSSFQFGVFGLICR